MLAEHIAGVLLALGIGVFHLVPIFVVGIRYLHLGILGQIQHNLSGLAGRFPHDSGHNRHVLAAVLFHILLQVLAVHIAGVFLALRGVGCLIPGFVRGIGHRHPGLFSQVDNNLAGLAGRFPHHGAHSGHIEAAVLFHVLLQVFLGQVTGVLLALGIGVLRLAPFFVGGVEHAHNCILRHGGHGLAGAAGFPAHLNLGGHGVLDGFYRRLRFYLLLFRDFVGHFRLFQLAAAHIAGAGLAIGIGVLHLVPALAVLSDEGNSSVLGQGGEGFCRTRRLCTQAGLAFDGVRLRSLFQVLYGDIAGVLFAFFVDKRHLEPLGVGGVSDLDQIALGHHSADYGSLIGLCTEIYVTCGGIGADSSFLLLLGIRFFLFLFGLRFGLRFFQVLAGHIASVLLALSVCVVDLVPRFVGSAGHSDLGVFRQLRQNTVADARAGAQTNIAAGGDVGGRGCLIRRKGRNRNRGQQQHRRHHSGQEFCYSFQEISLLIPFYLWLSLCSNRTGARA